MGLTLADLLGRADGPHAEVADLWVSEDICEICYTAPPFDDGLCASCISDLIEAAEST